MRLKKGIHDYDTRITRLWVLIQNQVSPKNVTTIQKYDNLMVSLSMAKATRQKHLQTLLNLTRFLKKDWNKATKKDIERLVVEIARRYADDNGQETHTTYDHKKILKIFFRWLKLGSREFSEVGDPPETRRIKSRKIKDKIVREDLLTDEDVNKLLVACGENARDRALIHCHSEGGTRPGEILSLQIKHVKFDQYGANLHVDGKMGPRTIRLVKSTPSLASWLSVHPFKNNPDAFVWINLSKNLYGDQLRYPATRAIFIRRAKMAKLKKRVNLNMFRHSEATDSAKFMTESQLKIRHGWSPTSKMPARYVHLINADVDDAIFKHLGIKTEKKDDIKVPKICHICKTRNHSDQNICGKCGALLSLKDFTKQLFSNIPKTLSIKYYLVEKQVAVLQVCQL